MTGAAIQTEVTSDKGRRFLFGVVIVFLGMDE